MSTNKNVATQNSAGQLATINQRAFAGKGTEEIGQDDVNTPILKILHQLSPECNSRNAKFVKDAKPGMIYSNSFGCLVEGSKGLPVIVAHSQTRWPEWQQKGETVSDDRNKDELKKQFVEKYGLWACSGVVIQILLQREGFGFGASMSVRIM